MLTYASDLVRRSLGPTARRRLRRLVDPMLAPVGSVHGARRATDKVALTFDDGPDPDVTPRLLDLLQARRARATFFVLTEKVAQNPGLLRRIVEEGHEVGLHFDRHDRLTQLPLGEARARLRQARRQLEGVVGPVRLFRPPYGSQSLSTYFMARSEGMDVVAWGPYAEDWVEQSPATAANKALGPIMDGDIVLMHDGLEIPPGEPIPTFDRVKMVEIILDGLAERGLGAESVGALVAAGGVRRSAWFRR